MPFPPKPALTVDQILAWADEHHQRTGAMYVNACSLLTVAQRTELPDLIVDTRLQPHRDKSSDTSNV
jgi:hypothetical protein